MVNQNAPSLSVLLQQLSTPYCILAGAGISYPPPSSLLDALGVMQQIISSLPIPSADRDTLLAALSPDWEDGLGYFDFLRFEQLNEALQQSADEHLTLLRLSIPDTPPNRYHYQLARLLQSGNLLLTTNFDCLIEKACDELGIAYTVLVSEADYEAYLTDPARFPHPIFKLHGSFPQGEDEPPSPVSATIQSVIAERALAPAKWSVVEDLFARHDLLVIGYSGSDDFDVTPALLFSPGARRLLWIQHSASPAPLIWRLSDDRVPPGYHLSHKLHWTFGRSLGSFRTRGRVKRRPEDICIVMASTVSVLDQLVPGMGVPPPSAEAAGYAQLARSLLGRAALAKLGTETPRALLLAAMLCYEVGLFEAALRFLGRALDLCAPDTPSAVVARIHALIADIWLARDEQARALDHMIRAREHFQRLDRLVGADLIHFVRFYCQLGLDQASRPLAEGAELARDLETDRQRTFIRRELALWEARWWLRTKGLLQAMEHLRATIADEPGPLGLEQRADAIFLMLQIDREASRITGSSLLGREKGGLGAARDLQLDEVTEVYELLQCKKKWADVVLFHAEDYLAAGFAEWADEAAAVAGMIYRKIGSRKGAARSLELQAEIAKAAGDKFALEQHQRELGLLAHETRRQAGPADEVHYFCPQCNRVTHFRVQHCTECGWWGSDAPQSDADQKLGFAERFALIQQFLSKRG